MGVSNTNKHGSRYNSMATRGMKWTPSVIQTVGKEECTRQEKKSRLEEIMLEISIKTQNTGGRALGGGPEPKRLNTKPVVLTLMYQNDLYQKIDTDEKMEDREILDKKIVQVKKSGKVLDPGELTSAIRDSIRAEQLLIQRLDRNEKPEKSEMLVTNETCSYYIGKERLLGEILKAQRKLEKLRKLGALWMQKALEDFIKKLCALKVLSEKDELREAEASSTALAGC